VQVPLVPVGSQWRPTASSSQQALGPCTRTMHSTNTQPCQVGVFPPAARDFGQTQRAPSRSVSPAAARCHIAPPVFVPGAQMVVRKELWQEESFLYRRPPVKLFEVMCPAASPPASPVTLSFPSASVPAAPVQSVAVPVDQHGPQLDRIKRQLSAVERRCTSAEREDKEDWRLIYAELEARNKDILAELTIAASAFREGQLLAKSEERAAEHRVVMCEERTRAQIELAVTRIEEARTETREAHAATTASLNAVVHERDELRHQASSLELTVSRLRDECAAFGDRTLQKQNKMSELADECSSLRLHNRVLQDQLTRQGARMSEGLDPSSVSRAMSDLQKGYLDAAMHAAVLSMKRLCLAVWSKAMHCSRDCNQLLNNLNIQHRAAYAGLESRYHEEWQDAASELHTQIRGQARETRIRLHHRWSTIHTRAVLLRDYWWAWLRLVLEHSMEAVVERQRLAAIQEHQQASRSQILGLQRYLNDHELTHLRHQNTSLSLELEEERAARAKLGMAMVAGMSSSAHEPPPAVLQQSVDYLEQSNKNILAHSQTLPHARRDVLDRAQTEKELLKQQECETILAKSALGMLSGGGTVDAAARLAASRRIPEVAAAS